MSQQERYLQEYEKFRHIRIEVGSYAKKSNTFVTYTVTHVDLIEEVVSLTTDRSGNRFTKTLHWCRKNLIALEK